MRHPLLAALAAASLLAACTGAGGLALPGTRPDASAKTLSGTPVPYKKVALRPGFPFSAAPPGSEIPTGPYVLRSQADLDRLSRLWRATQTLTGVDFETHDVFVFGWRYSACQPALGELAESGGAIAFRLGGDGGPCASGGIGPGGSAAYSFAKTGKKVTGAPNPPKPPASMRELGRFAVGTAPPEGGPARRLRVGADGSVWIAHPHEEKVFKLTEKGEAAGEWAVAGDPGRPGVAPDGTAWIPTATGVTRIETDGTLGDALAIAGGAHAVAFDAEGRAWVTTRPTDGLVLRYPASGGEPERLTLGDEPRVILFNDATTAYVLDAKGAMAYHNLLTKVLHDPEAFPAVDTLTGTGTGNRTIWVAAPGAKALGIYEGAGTKFGEHLLDDAVDGFDFAPDAKIWLALTGSNAVVRATLVDPLRGEPKPDVPDPD
jgi:hypothetical protein